MAHCVSAKRRFLPSHMPSLPVMQSTRLDLYNVPTYETARFRRLSRTQGQYCKTFFPLVAVRILPNICSNISKSCHSTSIICAHGGYFSLMVYFGLKMFSKLQHFDHFVAYIIHKSVPVWPKKYCPDVSLLHCVSIAMYTYYDIYLPITMCTYYNVLRYLPIMEYTYSGD